MRDAWAALASARRDGSLTPFTDGEVGAMLDDLSGARIERMDESGVDHAVLSLTTPGVQNLDSAVAVPLARRTNDLLAEAVRAHPDRFGGFAALPPRPSRGVVALDGDGWIGAARPRRFDTRRSGLRRLDARRRETPNPEWRLVTELLG